MPKASNPAKIKLTYDKTFINMLVLNMYSHSEKYSTKCVRKYNAPKMGEYASGKKIM